MGQIIVLSASACERCHLLLLSHYIHTH